MAVKVWNVDSTLYSMLVEDTGVNFLDSGGAYGRHWERNQKLTIEDFINRPDVTFERNEDGSIDYITVDLFNYLRQILDVDDICNRFNELPVNNWDGGYGLSSEGREWLEVRSFGLGATFNSYNHESNLSQIIQFTLASRDMNFDIGGYGYEPYVLLQIHNGCDARGGYTNAKLFQVLDPDCVHEGFAYIDDNPNVYATIIKPNKDMVLADTGYDGFQLTYDSEQLYVDPNQGQLINMPTEKGKYGKYGEPVEINPEDVVEMHIIVG